MGYVLFQCFFSTLNTLPCLNNTSRHSSFLLMEKENLYFSGIDTNFIKIENINVNSIEKIISRLKDKGERVLISTKWNEHVIHRISTVLMSTQAKKANYTAGTRTQIT